jgi:DNA adenine methylase
MGSKARIAKDILPIILTDREDRPWVEPFVGGGNMIDKVSGVRVGADTNKYLIAMFKDLVSGLTFPSITKSVYDAVKTSYKTGDGNYSDGFIGWVGFNCSYSGKFFGGFAGKVNTRQGVRDYQNEAFRNMEAQLPNLQGVEFIHTSYQDLVIDKPSLIYCDPPYRSTTSYNSSIDHDEFYTWCTEQVDLGHIVYASEYDIPHPRFIQVWEKEVKSSLSANGNSGGNKLSVERLYKVI